MVFFAGISTPVFAKKNIKAPVGVTSQNTNKKIKQVKQKTKERTGSQDKKIKVAEKKAQQKAGSEAKKSEAAAKKAQKAQEKEQKKLTKKAEKKSSPIVESEENNSANMTKAEKKALKKAQKAEKKAIKKNKSGKVVADEEVTKSEKKVKSSKKVSKVEQVGATPIERELILIEKRHLDANKKRSKLAMYLNPNLGIREVRASHILVKKRKDAIQIKKDIESGVITFEEAARQYSLCPSSVNGGDLGFFDRKKMEPMFSEAAFDQKVGQISDPVGTKFGWHIIKTTDKR